MLMRGVAQLLSPAGPKARLSVLIYHRVRPEMDALRPDEIDAAGFSLQMQVLARNFNVLPLPEAVQRLARGELPARAACITFDDGYLDNLEVALPILQAQGLSATFFVASGYLRGEPMWNDVIIESIRLAPGDSLNLSPLGLGERHGLDTPARRSLYVELIGKSKYLPAPARADFVAELHALCGAPTLPALMMSEQGVRDLHAAGMPIGAHTRSHPILSRLDQAEARGEIQQGRDDLTAIIGDSVELFAYPNGKPGEDYTAEHARMVQAAGFSAAVSTAWGSAGETSDPFQLPRFTPWERGQQRFVLRLLQNLMRGPEQRA